MKTFTRWLRNILIFFFTSTILAVVILKYIPVYITPLMLIRAVEAVIDGEKPQIIHRWVPLEEINHHLPQAVMASEDNLFLKHHGFDLEQIQKAQIEAQEGKRQRGASTISSCGRNAPGCERVWRLISPSLSRAFGARSASWRYISTPLRWEGASMAPMLLPAATSAPLPTS